MKVLKTGCNTIDLLMDGGIPPYPIGFYGIYDIGKSFMCAQVAAMATRPESEGGLDADVLMIDTEDFWDDGTFGRIFGYYKRRWQLSNSDLERITVMQVPDIFKLGRQFGLEIQIVQSASKVSAITKFPKKKTSSPTKSTLQVEDWIEYAPLYKAMKKRDVPYGLIILDSITVPIKGVIPTDPQHLSGRSTVEDSLLAAIKTLSSEFSVPIIITNHGVGMSGQGARFFGAVKPWGGGAMIYFIKRWIGILEAYKAQKDSYGEQIRRVIRYRWPGLLRTEVLSELKKNYGYTDPPSGVEVSFSSD